MAKPDHSKLILLVLDLDETLIHACEEPLDREADFRLSQFHVYRRPFLREFLEACSRSFRLAVWSTASDNYVVGIVNEIFPDPANLEFVWGRSRSTIRRMVSSDVDENMRVLGHMNYQKHLKKLVRFGWPVEKMLIIDDSPEKCVQNYGNAIYPRAFEGDANDKELILLARYLGTLKDCENVRKIEKRGWRAKVSDAH